MLRLRNRVHSPPLTSAARPQAAVICAAGGWFAWQAARLVAALQRLAFAACFSGHAAGLALPGRGPASAAALGVGLQMTPTEILFDLVRRDQLSAVHSFRRRPLVFTRDSLCFPTRYRAGGTPAAS